MKQKLVFCLALSLAVCCLPPPCWANPSGQTVFPDLLEEEAEGIQVDETPPLEVYDPLEPVNRVFFRFNDRLYEWILKPTTKAYAKLMPLELRQSFGHFFHHLAMPVSLLNSLLQWDLPTAGIVLQRFAINTTLGVYGLADVAASEFHILPRGADFGQTLGRWGMGEGVYLFWPVAGPSNIRDTIGLVADAYSHPMPYINDDMLFSAAYYSTDKVNALSLVSGLYDDLKRYSLDPYIASRQMYYEYRRGVIERK